MALTNWSFTSHSITIKFNDNGSRAARPFSVNSVSLKIGEWASTKGPFRKTAHQHSEACGAIGGRLLNLGHVIIIIWQTQRLLRAPVIHGCVFSFLMTPHADTTEIIREASFHPLFPKLYIRAEYYSWVPQRHGVLWYPRMFLLFGVFRWFRDIY